jgi:hypothetical protein
VAVIQISRIQVRRGQKNQGSGIPQLAGGEFGWAMDSQELFIGNGSVAEGAPQVGNTKILTEHDNLFELADTYSYQTGGIVLTGPNANSPIKRTLQARLDDVVSIRSFGAEGDGTDQTVQIQRAIDQLFLNEATKGSEESRVILNIEPGVYLLSDSIKIPPHANIVGAGAEKTFFKQVADAPIFETVNLDSTPGVYADDSSSTSLTQPQYIRIEGMTLDSVATSSVLYLKSCRDSSFKDIKIKGYWQSGDAIDSTVAGLRLDSLSTLVTCDANKFENIEFVGLDAGVSSDFDITNNIWENCKFETLGYGVVFGATATIGSQGQLTGPNKNTIHSSTFNDIDRQAIWVEAGKKNVSSHNRFYNVGNVGGTEANAQYSIIKFTSAQNESLDDFFERTELLGYDQNYIELSPYVSEIEGVVHTSLGGHHRLNLGQRNDHITLFRLPGDFTRRFEIEYNYESSEYNAKRSGTIEIILDKSSNSMHTVEDYYYLGDSLYEFNLTWEIELADLNSDTELETILVKVRNITPDDVATVTYNINVQTS